MCLIGLLHSSKYRIHMEHLKKKKNVLSHKGSLNFQRIKILQSCFSKQNAVQLENNKEITKK